MGLGHNESGTQWVWDTTGLGTIGLVHNGSGTQWVKPIRRHSMDHESSCHNYVHEGNMHMKTATVTETPKSDSYFATNDWLKYGMHALLYKIYKRERKTYEPDILNGMKIFSPVSG